MTKRLLDILLSAVALVILLPVILATALLVRLRLGSPILFRQTRPGLRGAPFQMLKLRSMLNAVDAHGNPLPNEQRLTPFGKFLRSTSLDELPELWNVLRGDMSIVGPRPLLMEYLPLYTPEQARRHDVRPGITGWAQVNGRNAISWDEKFRLDVWYVDNQSLRLDLRIILLTIRKVLVREGISHQGDVAMPRWTGSRGPSAVGRGPRAEGGPAAPEGRPASPECQVSGVEGGPAAPAGRVSSVRCRGVGGATRRAEGQGPEEALGAKTRSTRDES